VTKREQLQKIIDDAVEEKPILYRYYAEFRGRGGWWAVPEQQRFFGDNGEYLGPDFRTAKQTLMSLL
jgi:hypothetical protein